MGKKPPQTPSAIRNPCPLPMQLLVLRLPSRECCGLIDKTHSNIEFLDKHAAGSLHRR